MCLVTPAQNMSDHIYSLILTHVKYYSEREIDHVPLKQNKRNFNLIHQQKAHENVYIYGKIWFIHWRHLHNPNPYKGIISIWHLE